MNSTLVGRWGEALVAEYLRKKGFKIIAANYRTRFGEIDIIAESAAEFVTESKQKKLRSTAEIWLSANETKKDVRFDVAEIYAPDGISENYTINIIENAF